MTGLLLAWAVGFGLATAWLARHRDRRILVWAAFGALLGPVALVLLWVAPPGRCATCRSPVRGWITECEWCGSDVRGNVAPAKAKPAKAKPAKAKKGAKGGGAAPVISVAPTRRPGDDAATVLAVAPGSTAATAPARSEPIAAATAAQATAATQPAEPPPGPAADKPTKPRRGAKPTTSGNGKRPAKAPARDREMAFLTSGVYVTGTIGLAPGSRYTIHLGDGDLQVLGPSDRDPKAVAFERGLDGMDATGHEGRLILSAPGNRGGTVLVFMSVEGGTTNIAASIMQAAQAAHAAQAVGRSA